jgi:hypothetical protein
MLCLLTSSWEARRQAFGLRQQDLAQARFASSAAPATPSAMHRYAAYAVDAGTPSYTPHALDAYPHAKSQSTPRERGVRRRARQAAATAVPGTPPHAKPQRPAKADAGPVVTCPLETSWTEPLGVLCGLAREGKFDDLIWACSAPCQRACPPSDRLRTPSRRDRQGGRSPRRYVPTRNLMDGAPWRPVRLGVGRQIRSNEAALGALC